MDTVHLIVIYYYRHSRYKRNGGLQVRSHCVQEVLYVESGGRKKSEHSCVSIHRSSRPCILLVAQK
jgi:hypothetical protein